MKIKKNSQFEFIKLAAYEGDFLESVNKILDKYLLNDRKIPMNSLNKLLINLSDFFSSEGFPFVEINITYSEVKDSKTIEGSLKIISNEPRKIDGYIVKGYEKFPKKFIDKFLGVKIEKNLILKNLKTQLTI